MKKIQLIHWHAEEADERAIRLREAGYTVDTTLPNGPPFLRKLSEDPPAAVVIDLARLPSHGREIAMSIRMRKSTRLIPLVFVGGEIDKVERIRGLLPDATYTDWTSLFTELEKLFNSFDSEPNSPVVPQSIFDAYTGTPLPKKLGIKAGGKIGLAGEPPDFVDSLGELPIGINFVHDGFSECELVIWFVHSQTELQNGIRKMAEQLKRSSLWIAWQKKESNHSSDLSQQVVRDIGLENDLVDYKICSIDVTWSALLFTRRR